MKKVILASGIFALKDKFHVAATLLSPMGPDELSQPLNIGERRRADGCAVNTSSIVDIKVARFRDIRRRTI